MNTARNARFAAREMLDASPAVDVPEAEFRRLLGYPRGHVPGERALELARWARRQYAEHGRPWIYTRLVDVGHSGGRLLVDGAEFGSSRLREFLADAGASRAVLIAVSAGGGCEERASKLWNDSKPDEYFFLEVFGSAVVEHLVSLANGRICEQAERDNLVALPHYSPGYTGWDVTDQEKLFDLLTNGISQPLPGPLEILRSGMLRPKKSMLAVAGLVAGDARFVRSGALSPCQTCSFSPCQYRRAPYHYMMARDSGARGDTQRPFTSAAHPRRSRGVRYTVNPKALRKWARERVRLSRAEDGLVKANFHFDGTTCSNLGRPLAFDYELELGPRDGGFVLLGARCRPAPGDTGHTFMCAYLNDAAALMAAIEAGGPPLGGTLDEAIAWWPATSANGCHCDAASRAHKWVLALEAIHYALASTGLPSASRSISGLPA
jgi:hypothetical protein